MVPVYDCLLIESPTSVKVGGVFCSLVATGQQPLPAFQLLLHKPPAMYKIVLICQHTAWLNRWKELLQEMPGFLMAGSFSSLKSAQAFLDSTHIDVLVSTEKILSDLKKNQLQYPVWLALTDASPAEQSRRELPPTTIFADIPWTAGFDRMFAVMNLVHQYLDRRQEASTVSRNFIFVKSEYKLIKLLLADILFLSGLRDYTQIFQKGKVSPLTTLQNLKDFESRLPHRHFIRVHRSYMVAIDQVESISRNEITIGTHTIPVGHAYRSKLDEMTGKNS